MPHMHEEGELKERGVPGPQLYFHAVMPEKDPAAMIGIVPGYADHGARYSHVMEAWADRGIGSVALDLRGHGRATGSRGHCSRFDEFLDDASELAHLVSLRARGAPMFLFGHSFGGLVATASVLADKRSWRGLVLSAPYFGLALEVNPLKLAAGRIASRIAPRLGLPSGLMGKDMTHDPVRAAAYDGDPLVFPKATARWFRETQKQQEQMVARVAALDLPLYVVFGTKDPVAKMSAARAVFDAAGSTDKTWNAREGNYHEVLNELEWPELAGSIADWVLAHARSA
jgi:alpha-beta hydrolase superfamily lysophospholipase